MTTRPEPEHPVSLEAFRGALSRVPTPVTVVTTMREGRAHGTTVSAFSSLSARPPLVLVALDETSDLLRLLGDTQRFGLNVLAADQHEIALTCARKGPDKFASVPWQEHSGLPRIDNVASWLACDVHDRLPGGDHTIVVGGVTECEVSSAMPLVYHGRAFSRLVTSGSPSEEEWWLWSALL